MIDMVIAPGLDVESAGPEAVSARRRAARRSAIHGVSTDRLLFCNGFAATRY